eukprot:TRINITY_DN6254_c0_g2_i1.p1 TRINITY_DN6254_c0_g2~~TRINITY_DN6254_c0_g2_i1.p1  ORF type:complete len:159 (-),score=23.69 TRINITY_DN6254_c0_g2_i1:123-599(-)
MTSAPFRLFVAFVGAALLLTLSNQAAAISWNDVEKLVPCLLASNCTSCRASPGCAWCPQGTLSAAVGSAKLTYSSNAVCWSGGFASFTNTQIDEPLGAGLSLTIAFQCNPALATTVVCPVPDIPGVLGICVVVLIPILIILICCCCRRRNRRRVIYIQ